jgi:hypothetical protein
MKQVPVMQDGVTSLNATYFNDIPRELENLIQAASIVLSGADLNQAGAAVSVFVAGSDFYACANTGDAYALSAVESLRQPPAYFVGYRARFKASATNTTIAPTVNIGAIGAVPLNFGHLENLGTPAVAIGDIAEDQVYEIVYSKTDDGLTAYWRLVNGAGEQTRAKYIDASGTSYAGISVTNSGKGMSYENGPGGDVKDARVETFDISSFQWFANADAGILWEAQAQSITFSDIPYSSDAVYSCTFRFVGSAGSIHSCPMFCRFYNSGGSLKIDQIAILSVFDPDPTRASATNGTIVMAYKSTDVD